MSLPQYVHPLERRGVSAPPDDLHKDFALLLSFHNLEVASLSLSHMPNLEGLDWPETSPQSVRVYLGQMGTLYNERSSQTPNPLEFPANLFRGLNRHRPNKRTMPLNQWKRPQDQYLLFLL